MNTLNQITVDDTVVEYGVYNSDTHKVENKTISIDELNVNPNDEGIYDWDIIVDAIENRARQDNQIIKNIWYPI